MTGEEADLCIRRRRAIKRVDKEISRGGFKNALSLVKQLQGKPGGGLRGFGVAKQVSRRFSSFNELNLDAKYLVSLQPLSDSIMESIEESNQFNSLDKVKIDNLKRKKPGLYFSACWSGPCQRFTTNLVEVYNELSPKGDFEVVFISSDRDEKSFNEYFSKIPWLAVPFSDSETRDRLNESFEVMGILHLVILDADGKLLSDSRVKIMVSMEWKLHC